MFLLGCSVGMFAIILFVVVPCVRWGRFVWVKWGETLKLLESSTKFSNALHTTVKDLLHYSLDASVFMAPEERLRFINGLQDTAKSLTEAVRLMVKSLDVT